MLDRAYMQFLTFMDDLAYRDEHRVHVELIHTLARVGPNTEPKFREECKSLPLYYFLVCLLLMFCA